MPSIGFPAVARPDARLLILGSLPGAASLRQQQYYANPQNGFWRIMGALVGAAPDLPYATRLDRLTEGGIALWDVCEAAERAGSLDSNIRAPRPNDFATFFARHPAIEAFAFNGQVAARLYHRHVGRPDLPVLILPSTSPAHAGMGFDEKCARWREALQPFLMPPDRLA